jgi:hypothetical protein
VLIKVVFPRPDSPLLTYMKECFKEQYETKRPTDDHNGEMSTVLGHNFVPLKDSIYFLSKKKINQGVKRTWFGRLAMPIPSEEGTVMVESKSRSMNERR